MNDQLLSFSDDDRYRLLLSSKYVRDHMGVLDPHINGTDQRMNLNLPDFYDKGFLDFEQFAYSELFNRSMCTKHPPCLPTHLPLGIYRLARMPFFGNQRHKSYPESSATVLSNRPSWFHHVGHAPHQIKLTVHPVRPLHPGRS